jgi:hypothetical protein
MSARRVGPSPLLATSNSAPATGALYGAILHVPLGIPRVAAAPRPATSATSATSANFWIGARDRVRLSPRVRLARRLVASS